MKKSVKISCALACVAIIALCGHSLKKNNIVVEKQVLTTKQECIEEFGKTGKSLLKGKKSKLYPIKITVNNKTNKDIVFHETNLKTAPNKLVYKKLKPHKSIVVKAMLFWLGIFSGSFTISCGIAVLGMGLLSFNVINGCIALMLSSIIMPSIASTLYLHKNNLAKKKKKTKKMNIIGIVMRGGAAAGMVDPLVGIAASTLSIFIYLLSGLLVVPSTISASIATPGYFRKKTIENNIIKTMINSFKSTTIKAGETTSFFLFVKQSEYEEKPFSLTFKNIKNESELFTVTV